MHKLLLFCPFFSVFGVFADSPTFYMTKSCLDVQFNRHWVDLFTRKESALAVAFERTALRFGQSRPISWVYDEIGTPVRKGPTYTNCLVDFPVNVDGNLIPGIAYVRTDFQWYESMNNEKILAHEGLKIGFLPKYVRNNDPASVQIVAVISFSFCRVRSECEQSIIPQPPNNNGPVNWVMFPVKGTR